VSRENHSPYADHVATLQQRTEAALGAAGYDALILDAGTPFTYFADDQEAPFRTAPHFAHWVPLEGPHHLLLVRKGERPKLLRVRPEDYWYEQAPLGDPEWLGAFDFAEVPDTLEAWKGVATRGKVAYVGDSRSGAESHRLPSDAINPEALLPLLDWNRSYKTAYEIACLDAAAKHAARGHAAARRAFVENGSELDIHHAFVTAVGCADKDLPYDTIVALDEKGATLHYTGKRTTRGGKSLLIDAGARHAGYGSDITRTWTTDACDPVFRELVRGVDRLQQDLCSLVRPGRPYLDLHLSAHVMIADLLHEQGILKSGGESAVERGLTLPFFPHGLGHFLGIQVHDVSGRQKAPAGGTVAPPPQHPHLRTTRTIEPDQVFTIEPGLYFIEMLLRAHRPGSAAGKLAHSDQFDWKLIERLMPCGGIRIEDDVVVTRDGHRNLTRPHLS
jgi:Xaa-Pro dipeptidase